MPAKRALIWVQHLLGTGHVRRAAALAHGLADRGVTVAVTHGGGAETALAYDRRITLYPLPAVRALTPSFTPLVDKDGAPIDAPFKKRRTVRLLEVLATVAPDLIVIEGYPFARRAFGGEVTALLETAHARTPRPRIACSVRDVLVAKPHRDPETAAVINRLFDLVLIHGDPYFIPFEPTFFALDRIGRRVHYTGFMGRRPDPDGPPGDDGAGEILVSAGGGAVAGPVIEAALAAHGPVAARRPDLVWRLLIGPDTPGDLAARAWARAGPTLIVEAARPDFPALLRRCALSISQAGYNTVLDTLGAGCRAILIPFARAGESEQAIRAGVLAERGRVTVLEEASATGDRLAERVLAALAVAPPAPMAWADGASRSAELLLGQAPAAPGLSRAPFADLAAELARWRAAGRPVPVWWRDDDAVAPTPALDRLANLSRRHAVPMALAVIPAQVAPVLAEAVGQNRHWTVLQHGWAHANHRPAGQKRAELAQAQGREAILDCLGQGYIKLLELFGNMFFPVLVPPWNRADAAVMEGLVARGVWRFSGFRGGLPAVPGSLSVDTHLDPVDWRRDRRFLGTEPVLRHLTTLLQARRTGQSAADGPIGVLSHHLAHDDATWAFLDSLISVFQDSQGVQWLTAMEAFDVSTVRTARAPGAAAAAPVTPGPPNQSGR